jgi:hypothetical protein
MFNENFRLIKVLWQTHKIPIAVWGLIQLACFYAFHCLMLDVDIPISLEDRRRFVESPNDLVYLAVLLATSYMALLIGLGIVFNGTRSDNWLLQLPVTGFSLNVLPMCLIVIYSLAVTILIPWGPVTAGLGVFTMGIPVVLFLILKNSRGLVEGLLKTLVAGPALMFFWIQLFWDWGQQVSGLKVDLIALAIFSVLIFWFARSGRRHVFAPIALVLLVISLNITLQQLQAPANFTQAVQNHVYFPTEKSWTNFKQMALDRKVWESSDQKSLSPNINQLADQAAQGLNADERFRYIENVALNDELWKSAGFSAYRNLALYPMGLNPYLANSRYPVSSRLMTPELENRIYENWPADRVFCYILPFRKERRHLEKILLSSECSPALFEISPVFSLYDNVNPGPYEDMVDSLLVDPRKPIKIENKQTLFTVLNSAWFISADPDSHPIKSNEGKTLDKEILEKTKALRWGSDRKKLRMLPTEAEGFRRQLTEIALSDSEWQGPIYRLCSYVAGNCTAVSLTENRKPPGFLDLLLSKVRNPRGTIAHQHLDWMKEEILKPANTAKILELLVYLQRQ